jgi:hypothetical protein
MVSLIQLIGFTHFSPYFLKLAGMAFDLVLFVYQMLVGARQMAFDPVRLSKEVLRFITKDVLKSRPPGIPPDSFERTHNSRSDKMPIIRRHVSQQIECYRILDVSWIEVHQMIGTVGWNVVENFFSEITVRIDEPNAMA